MDTPPVSSAELPLVVPRPLPAAPARRLTRTPRLSVVVVNYHRWDETASVVRQLRASPALHRGDAEVIVVDNNSPWHPLLHRLRRLPGVSLRRWRRNRGFARAVNEGCRLARGDWLLLLNPDVTLAPGFLARALRTAERRAAERPELGVVGFRLLNPDGSHQPSTGPFPTLSGTVARLLLPRRLRKYNLLAPAEAGPVDWATGCCLLVRRSCWEQLGGFDRDFFLYYEDVDLCRRARAAGWGVAFEPGVSAVHHHPLHARDVPPYLRLVTRHALLTYAGKHWPRWQTRVLAGIVRAEARLRAFVARRLGDERSAAVFDDLCALTADLVRGDRAAAEGRLLRVVYREERERGAALPRNSQP
jgi:GT2 family glycosyltransferase